MNLREASGSLRALAFRLAREVARFLPAGKIGAFGAGADRIGSILVINLDRQPQRLRRVLAELDRFRSADDMSLVTLVNRLSAIDARDGRAVAATADVDTSYRMGDQLFVQPDARLEASFSADEPIRMTRQEVAVARSHIEAWKRIAAGSHEYVLVLEDDVWFARGAAAAIDKGWREALDRCREAGGPRLLYLSYSDAGGTADRFDISDALFRPRRGLWYLSGYVVSREGASSLLRAMPVVGPVDLWINYKFTELGALALSKPVVLQRQDGTSENSYSILPFLARAGVVDAGSGRMRPPVVETGLVLGFSDGSEHEGLAMALSMLGLRVRVFDEHEVPVDRQRLIDLGRVYDALVDAPLTPEAIAYAQGRSDMKFILERGKCESLIASELDHFATTVLDEPGEVRSWRRLCRVLGLTEPADAYPLGAPRDWGLFRGNTSQAEPRQAAHPTARPAVMDESPWVLPARYCWQPRSSSFQDLRQTGELLVDAPLASPSSTLPAISETFPGNLASFEKGGVVYGPNGAELVVRKALDGRRPYQSGALASLSAFGHGRFEAEIRAARGEGLITGFFLHRDLPRQEIDLELPGSDPTRLLANVYFNPGDDGAAMGFGYRGSPCHIELGFDASADFHRYAIEWWPDRIAWSADGRIIHERRSWDPTPVPHLPMRLHANLWVPRSEELAGRVTDDALPSSAFIRNVRVSNHKLDSAPRSSATSALAKLDP